MKLSKVCLALILVSISTVGQTFDVSEEAALKDIVKGFGFCVGQDSGLRRVRSMFPEFQAAATMAELQFSGKFGKACDFFDGLVPESLKESVLSKSEELSRGQLFTRSHAIEFLQLVQRRGAGQVESPFLETLLTWHPDFKDKPELEFNRGFTKPYSTANHTKAKGVTLEVRVPVSWISREGNRPNIIQFFRAKNGFSNVSFALMVKDFTLPKGARITQKSLDLMFSPRGLKELVDDGMLVESRPITLEGLKGGFWVVDMVGERLEQKLSIRMAQYGIVFKDKFILLQFSTGGDPTNRSQWLKDFELNRPLFELVANSLVIADLYKN